MKKEEFKKWLEKNKSYTMRTIIDKMSRGLRIEKMFQVKMDLMKNDDEYYQKIIKKLDRELQDKTDHGINLELCRSQLKNSLNLYRKFLKSTK